MLKSTDIQGFTVVDLADGVIDIREHRHEVAKSDARKLHVQQLDSLRRNRITITVM